MNKPRPVIVVLVSGGLSAIPGVGGPIQTVFDAIVERVRYRAEITGREICEDVGSDTVLRRINENPELEPLLNQAIEAAARTGMEAKRRLLARAAAAAFKDDENIEPASLIVSALSELEPVHIRALARLEEAATSALGQDESQQREVMKEASKAEAVPVLAALIQTGVAIPMTLTFQDGLGYTAEQSGHVLIHDVSNFGRRLLAHLRAADEDSERLIP